MTSERQASAKVRQMQLIRHGVVFLLLLCIAVFGVMIVLGINRQNNTKTSNNADTQVETSNQEATQESD